MAHTPMAITHFGSGICSYIRLTWGAIFQVKVPATIIKSACRGEERKSSIPNREISKRGAARAIISKAQQARPKVAGQTDERRPQSIRPSMLVTSTFRLISSLSQASGSGIAWVACRRRASMAAPSTRSISRQRAISAGSLGAMEPISIQVLSSSRRRYSQQPG